MEISDAAKKTIDRWLIDELAINSDLAACTQLLPRYVQQAIDTETATMRAELAEARRHAMVEAAGVAWDSIVECAEDNQLTWKPDMCAHDVQEHVNNRIFEAIAATKEAGDG